MMNFPESVRRSDDVSLFFSDVNAHSAWMTLVETRLNLSRQGEHSFVALGISVYFYNSHELVLDQGIDFPRYPHQVRLDDSSMYPEEISGRIRIGLAGALFWHLAKDINAPTILVHNLSYIVMDSSGMDGPAST